MSRVLPFFLLHVQSAGERPYVRPSTVAGPFKQAKIRFQRCHLDKISPTSVVMLSIGDTIDIKQVVSLTVLFYDLKKWRCVVLAYTILLTLGLSYYFANAI